MAYPRQEPEKWRSFGEDCTLDGVGAKCASYRPPNHCFQAFPDSSCVKAVSDTTIALLFSFQGDALPDDAVECPPDQQTPLDGLDLPSLDDLLWQDSVCNDFGVPSVSIGASGHVSRACQKEGCKDCAQSRGAGQQPAGPVSLTIPWSSQHEAAAPKQEQRDDAQHGVDALETPPQTGRPQKAPSQQEPSSSRDSNPTHLSPQSSCDLPDSNGHKRRRAEDSSPERAGRASSSEGKSACTAAAAPQQVGKGMHAGRCLAQAELNLHRMRYQRCNSCTLQ